MRHQSFLSGALLAGWIGGAVVAQSLYAAPITLPYNQLFTTTSTDVRTDTNYPEFSDVSPSFILFPVDSDHVLHLLRNSNAETLATVTPSNFNLTGQITIRVDVTAFDSSGNYNVGLKLGTGASANNIFFHPGFLNGAFRVDGPGGSSYATNTSMGYTPANNVFQHVEIDLFSSGLVNIRISDSADPINHIFTASYTNTAVFGSSIALRRFGNITGDGLFTNFSITQAVPEPAALGILAVTGIGAMRRRSAHRR